ncbi:hypothetical protein HAX54_030028 [Datura stramonium]|uniref:Uncharacterized protein n=1 Tax=Datura stramonium TaxID=4076 RepID=A0ABS8VAD1_DATST|nr:hypothetical protein [Datura stramonium]
MTDNVTIKVSELMYFMTMELQLIKESKLEEETRTLQRKLQSKAKEKASLEVILTIVGDQSQLHADVVNNLGKSLTVVRGENMELHALNDKINVKLIVVKDRFVQEKNYYIRNIERKILEDDQVNIKNKNDQISKAYALGKKSWDNLPHLPPKDAGSSSDAKFRSHEPNDDDEVEDKEHILEPSSLAVHPTIMTLVSRPLRISPLKIRQLKPQND